MSRSKSERAAAALDGRWARALLARLPAWRGVLVLNYHRIGDPTGQPFNRELWSATATGFDEHVAFLSRHADVVGPGDLPSLAARRRGRHVMLTFDDGYRDNYELAYPLLRRHGLTATFFLATGFLDRPHVAWWDEIAWMVRHAERDELAGGRWLPGVTPLRSTEERAVTTLVERFKTLPGEQTEEFLDWIAEGTGTGRCGAEHAAGMWLTWEEVREMRAGGMTIGGHTVAHPVLARLTTAEQEREITGCARRLHEELGEEMRWFSYPVGSRDSFAAETRTILRATGVALAFSFYGGHARFGTWDPLDVPRVYVGMGLDRRLLHAMVRAPALFARPDPVRRFNARRSRGARGPRSRPGA